MPDSNINEAASHGFVNFSIAQKPNLPLLTQINNKADIYFDFNSPVGTNEHHLLVNKTSATSSPNNAVTSIRAYPNPAEAGDVWLETSDPAGIILQVQVLDALGRLHFSLHRNRVQISLPDPKGLYFVRVLTDHGDWKTVKISR